MAELPKVDAYDMHEQRVVARRWQTAQARRGQRIVDLLLKIGGAPGSPFEVPGYYSRRRGDLDRRFAKEMKLGPSNAAVQAAVENSEEWRNAVAEMSELYSIEVKQIMEMPRSTIERMGELAIRAQDFDTLTALDYALERYSEERPDLGMVRTDIHFKREELQAGAGASQAESANSKESYVIVERMCERGELFVNAARASGVHISDSEFSRGRGYSEARAVRLKDTSEPKDEAEKLSDDQSWRDTAEDFAGRYLRESARILDRGRTEQLIETADRMAAQAKEEMIFILYGVLELAQVEIDKLNSWLAAGETLGYEPNLHSERSGDRFMAVVGEIARSRAETP